MSGPWYQGLPEDAFKTETDKIYEKAFAKIREGLNRGLDFDSACSALEIEDDDLKKTIVDDMLKVLIAEEHFTHNIALDEMSAKFRISLERLEAAKADMLEDVRNTSIKAFYKSLGEGNA